MENVKIKNNTYSVLWALRALLHGRFAPSIMGASRHRQALWALRALRHGLKQNIDDARNNHILHEHHINICFAYEADIRFSHAKAKRNLVLYLACLQHLSQAYS